MITWRKLNNNQQHAFEPPYECSAVCGDPDIIRVMTGVNSSEDETAVKCQKCIKHVEAEYGNA